MQTLLVRADASPSVGLGHAMRCLALAQAWRDSGGGVVFMLPEGLPALEVRIRAEGMQVVQCTAGLTARQDASSTVEVARATGATWVVLDGYEFGPVFHDAIRYAGTRLLCIDDEAHLDTYRVDLVLNQNAYASAGMYGDSTTSELLVGSRYALLRREFLRPPARRRPISHTANRVLVTLGGTDPTGLTGAVLESLCRLCVASMEVSVVAGHGNPHLSQIADTARRLPRCRVFAAVEDMRPLMEWADVAISAAGSTLWELCYLGLPSAIRAVAANQDSAARFMVERGIAADLDEGACMDSAILQLLGDVDMRRLQSRRGQELIDGKGADRVVGRMNELANGGREE